MNKPAVIVRASLQVAAAVFVLWSGTCTIAGATGFFINQQSVKGLGRVDAGNSAAADDLGTLFFNPAGMTELWKSNDAETLASFGVHLIIPRSTQRNAGSSVATPGTLGTPLPYAGANGRDPTDPTPVPNLYVARKLAGGNTSVGIAINVPFGLETRSPDDWFGRYDAIEASLETINAGFVAAHALGGGWSIGGGIDIQYAKTSLTTAIPNPLTPGGPTAATDGRARTEGDAWTPGFNIGVMYDFMSAGRTRVGFHYRSRMKHEVKGTTEFSGLTGPLETVNGKVGARADLRLPAIATIGFRHAVNDRWVVLGEAEWFDWSTFNEIRTRFDDARPDAIRPTRYKDAYAVAIGAEYAIGAWTARGGVHYDTTPTVDGWRDTTVPDARRLWLGLGATYRMSNRMSLDVAFNHVFFRDTSIDLTRTFFDGTPLASAVNIRADVESVVNTVSVDFRYAF